MVHGRRQWKLGLYQGRYTKEEMERDAGKDFYSLYKEFAIGAVPRLAKIPGFLLRRPLKKILAKCDEPTLKSLSASMKAQDNRPVVGQITVPVTYFYADPGSLFSPALADWYKENIVTPYRAVCFPESTHMLVGDHPEKFAEEVSTSAREDNQINVNRMFITKHCRAARRSSPAVFYISILAYICVEFPKLVVAVGCR